MSGDFDGPTLEGAESDLQPIQDGRGAAPQAEMEVVLPSTAPDKPIEIPDRTFFRIGDVADLVGVKPYVLRYWESEFPMISPEKSTTGQRVYRRTDVETLLLIKHLLYQERYSIEGARKRLRELRRDGQLRTFKRDRVLGGEEHLARRERLQRLRDQLQELHQMVRQPLHDLFKL
ncbi:MAG TPA: MerR family transcriptional regulator [Bdellovibrionota bacterium]|nr:MerR family transcriptional regulator [Bdellovibrionota bacterium]